jgi:hypothetical protein
MRKQVETTQQVYVINDDGSEVFGLALVPHTSSYICYQNQPFQYYTVPGTIMLPSVIFSRYYCYNLVVTVEIC